MASYMQNRTPSSEGFFKSPQNHINHSFCSYLHTTKFKLHKEAHTKYVSKIQRYESEIWVALVWKIHYCVLWYCNVCNIFCN